MYIIMDNTWCLFIEFDVNVDITLSKENSGVTASEDKTTPQPDDVKEKIVDEEEDDENLIARREKHKDSTVPASNHP